MQKSSYMLSGLKLLCDKLTEKQFTVVTTAQYYGVLKYACQVWNLDRLHGTLKSKLDVAHYKLLRVIIRDYRRLYPREMLDLIGRAKPMDWSAYALASLVINISSSGRPAFLRDEILRNEYHECRKPTEWLFYDSSKKKVGHQALRNRKEPIMRRVGFPWRSLEWNWKQTRGKDFLRRILKSTFFP